MVSLTIKPSNIFTNNLFGYTLQFTKINWFTLKLKGSFIYSFKGYLFVQKLPRPHIPLEEQILF